MSTALKYSSAISTPTCNPLPRSSHLTPSTSAAATATTLIPSVVPTEHIRFTTNGHLLVRLQMEEVASNMHHALISKRDSELHLAVRSRNLKRVKAIVKNNPELLESQDEHGWTPLSYAAYEGQTAITGYLLKYSKSTSKTNRDGSYPIHRACKRGQIEVLKLFPPKQLGQSDRYGRTVLHVAAEEGGDRLKHVVSYLMTVAEGRRLIHVRDENGWTSLTWAMRVKNYGVVGIIKQCMDSKDL